MVIYSVYKLESTSFISVFIRASEGSNNWPVILTLPCTVMASVGDLVFIPTLPLN